MFVTIPRFSPGVPATLTTVVQTEKGRPLLSPYPDWGWHREGACDGITSVFRVQVSALDTTNTNCVCWYSKQAYLILLSTFQRNVSPSFSFLPGRWGRYFTRKSFKTIRRHNPKNNPHKYKKCYYNGDLRLYHVTYTVKQNRVGYY